MPQVHRELAHAKLTRLLRVVGRRDDGMHLLEAEMVSIGLCDELEFTPSTQAGIEVVDASGVVGVPDLARGGADAERRTNLVLRALRLVERPAAVRLSKRIPAGAGLGGGSADAAAALRFAGCFDVVLAATLGADVPFCLVGGRADGLRDRRGDPPPLPPLDLTFVVLSPPFSVSTAAVYRAFDARSGSGGSAPSEYGNDLEDAALTVEPGLVAYRDLFAGVAGERRGSPAVARRGSSSVTERCPSSPRGCVPPGAVGDGARQRAATVRVDQQLR